MAGWPICEAHLVNAIIDLKPKGIKKIISNSSSFAEDAILVVKLTDF